MEYISNILEDKDLTAVSETHTVYVRINFNSKIIVDIQHKKQ